MLRMPPGAMTLSRRALVAAAASLAIGRRARADAERALVAHDAHHPSSERPPVIFVSHGAPIFAVNDPARIAELRAWGARLPKPRGVVVMTPHVASRRLEVGATGGGVALYDLPAGIKRRVPPGLTYATPSSAALAARIDAALGERAARSDREGFDHTTWMPLKCLLPAADVPVIELAYPYRPETSLFALGHKLAVLRDEGVLFVASGGMTHNLASMTFAQPPPPPPSWSIEFDAWATESVARLDADAIIDWRKKAPAQAVAHPDDGAHFRVLIVALGVALEGASPARRVSFPIVGYESTMSKRSIELA